MPRDLRSLAKFVHGFGFFTEAEMLRYFYEDNGLSIRTIGMYLKSPYGTIKDRLRAHGIALRERGGPNNRHQEEHG